MMMMMQSVIFKLLLVCVQPSCSETLESSDLAKEVAEDKKEEEKKKCDAGSEERGESCAGVH